MAIGLNKTPEDKAAELVLKFGNRSAALIAVDEIIDVLTNDDYWQVDVIDGGELLDFWQTVKNELTDKRISINGNSTK